MGTLVDPVDLHAKAWVDAVHDYGYDLGLLGQERDAGIVHHRCASAQPRDGNAIVIHTLNHGAGAVTKLSHLSLPAIPLPSS